MRAYHRLTQEDRYQIKALFDSGKSRRGIAAQLERAASTISRELLRNRGSKEYRSQPAHRRAQERRVGVGPPRRIDFALSRKIDVLLCKQWSPEQISAHLRMRRERVSTETIYQYIFADYRRGGELYQNLRRHRRQRRSRRTTANFKRKGRRVNQRWIAERPRVVDRRTRLGDVERDTVLGRKGGAVLITVVDRKSRYVRIRKIAGVNAEQTHRATLELLEETNVRTITNDNGPEFAFHAKTAAVLGVKIYFNDPYCSWQRGTNENTNGLIRQYFPKGHDFDAVSEEEIQFVEDLLNNRPRKCLRFKTPNQVHH